MCKVCKKKESSAGRKEFGCVLRMLRISRKLTMDTLAFDLDMSPNGYSKLEHNRSVASLKRITQIAGYFGLAPYELLWLMEPDADAEVHQRVMKAVCCYV